MRNPVNVLPRDFMSLPILARGIVLRLLPLGETRAEVTRVVASMRGDQTGGQASEPHLGLAR